MCMKRTCEYYLAFTLLCFARAITVVVFCENSGLVIVIPADHTEDAKVRTSPSCHLRLHFPAFTEPPCLLSIGLHFPVFLITSFLVCSRFITPTLNIQVSYNTYTRFATIPLLTLFPSPDPVLSTHRSRGLCIQLSLLINLFIAINVSILTPASIWLFNRVLKISVCLITLIT